ncbi:MAG: hypothetical protein JTJ20_07185 [Blautia sp.]|nr:hypothetical protein [Blautia sp.]
MADRTALGASFQTIQSMTSLVISMSAMPLVTVFGGGQKGWTVFMILAVFVGYLFLYVFMKNTKERHSVEAKKGEKVGLGGAVLGGVLSFIGYDGMAKTQTVMTLAGIKYIYVFGAVIPCILMILLLIPLGKLEKMRPEIEAGLREMDNQ